MVDGNMTAMVLVVRSWASLVVTDGNIWEMVMVVDVVVEVDGVGG